MKRILVIDQDNRMTWDELISQKIFHKDDQTKLPEQYRVTVDLKQIEKKKNNKPKSKT